MNSFASLRWPGQIFLSFLLLFPLACSSATTPPEKASPAPVSAEKAEEEELTETTEIFGMTQPLPNNSASVSANVSAQVRSILVDEKGKPVKEGQLVGKNDVIVQLDDRIIQKQKEGAQVALELAQKEVERLVTLRKDPQTRSSAPQYELDKAELLARKAQADLGSIEDQLKYYTVRSPIEGRLGRIRVQPGQSVSAGTVIADVMNLEKEIDALCFAAPHVARRLQLHQHAYIGTKENEGPEGEVVFIAQQAEPDTGQYAVKVRFPNHALFPWQREWRANAVVHVHVITQFHPKTWVIPLTALMEDQDPPRVVIVHDLKTEKNDEGKEEKVGKAQVLIAETGIRDQEHVEILSLKTAEKKEPVAIADVLFVIKGGQGLHDDDPVKLEEEEEKEREKENGKDHDQKKEKEKD
jgi:membrane fusion protein (multidrug efflux system)